MKQRHVFFLNRTLLSLLVLITCVTEVHSASANGKSCSSALSHEDPARTSVLSELASLRISIQDAENSKAKGLAFSLSAEYQKKLNAAVKLGLPVEKLNQLIEDHGHAADVEKQAKESQKARAEDSERAYRPFVHTSRIELSHNIRDLRFSDDGTLIATRNGDAAVTVFDAKNGEQISKQISKIEGDLNGFRSIHFSHDGHSILTISLTAILQIWDVKSGKVKREFAPSGEGSVDAIFSSDGRKIIALMHDHAVIIDLATGSMMKTEKQNGVSRAVRLSPNGKHFLIIAEEDSAIWDLDTARLIARLPTDSITEAQSAFSPDGNQVALLSSPGDQRERQSITLWNAQLGVKQRKFSIKQDGLIQITMNVKGTSIVIVYASGLIEAFDLDNGLPQASFVASDETVVAASVSPDRRMLLTLNQAKHVTLWDLNSFLPYQEIESLGRSISQVLFDPTGTSFVTVGYMHANIYRQTWVKPSSN